MFNVTNHKEFIRTTSLHMIGAMKRQPLGMRARVVFQAGEQDTQVVSEIQIFP